MKAVGARLDGRWQRCNGAEVKISLMILQISRELIKNTSCSHCVHKRLRCHKHVSKILKQSVATIVFFTIDELDVLPIPYSSYHFPFLGASIRVTFRELGWPRIRIETQGAPNHKVSSICFVPYLQQYTPTWQLWTVYTNQITQRWWMDCSQGHNPNNLFL